MPGRDGSYEPLDFFLQRCLRSFDMPRAHKPGGSLRLELFAFTLAPGVGAEIEVGDTVLLTNTSHPPQ